MLEQEVLDLDTYFAEHSLDSIQLPQGILRLEISEVLVHAAAGTMDCGHVDVVHPQGPKLFAASWQPRLVTCEECSEELFPTEPCCSVCGFSDDTYLFAVEWGSLTYFYQRCFDCQIFG